MNNELQAYKELVDDLQKANWNLVRDNQLLKDQIEIYSKLKKAYEEKISVLEEMVANYEIALKVSQ